MPIVDQMYKQEVLFALQMKVSELEVLGCSATVDEVWDALQQLRWKAEKRTIELNRIVSDILMMSYQNYMDYLSYKAMINANQATLESLIAEL